MRKQLNVATQAAQRFRATHDYQIADASPNLDNSNSGNTDVPTLEELEATADTYRKLYESILTAYTSSLQNQSYPYSSIRVITPASPPLAKSHPRTKLMLAFGTLLGLMSGVGSALVRRSLDRSIRSGRQIRNEFDLECLAEVPRVGARRRDRNRLTEVAESNSSPFAESIRRLKTGIGASGAAEAWHCIGVTSALAGEGKSTIATNLAILFSLSGRRTLVIDADVEKATITSALASKATIGVPETVAGPTAAKEAIVTIGLGRFDLLSMAGGPAHHDSGGLLSSGRMRDLLRELSVSYEMIVVDLPPLASAVDVLSVAPHMDGLVIVTEWGKTPLEHLSEMLHALRLVRATVIGVAINKVRGKAKNAYRRRRWKEIGWMPHILRNGIRSRAQAAADHNIEDVENIAPVRALASRPKRSAPSKG